MGFGQNLGWENGIYTPLQDPHKWTTHSEYVQSRLPRTHETQINVSIVYLN